MVAERGYPGIFISYAREDKERVRPIAEGLHAIGRQVWWEFPTLSPALFFTDECRTAIVDANWIVFLWSKRTTESNWSVPELSLVVEQRKLVSVILDADLDVPAPFDQLEQHDLSGWSGDLSAPEFQKFLSAFYRVLGPPEEATVFASRYPPGSNGASRPDTVSSPPPPSAEPESPAGDFFGASAVEPTALPELLKKRLGARNGTPGRQPESPLAKMNSPFARPSPAGGSVESMGGGLAQDDTRASSRSAGSDGEPEPYSYAPAPRSTPVMRLLRYAILAGGIALAGWLGLKLVPLIFGAVSSARPRKTDGPTGGANPVDCSVFAPPKLAVGDEILVQVYLHPPELADEAKADAEQFDSEAEWRGFTSLSLDLASGTRVGVQLEIADLTVSDDGIGEIRWNGRVTGISFLVSAAESTLAGKRHGTVRLLVDGVPAGRIHFIMELVSQLQEKSPAEPLGDFSHRYSKAFISYASEDRAEVLKRVQTLGALKIKYFQDVLDLDPGDRWEKELYKEIDECDLFMLFWSSASRDSEWVHKEALYARQRQIESNSDEPDIIPMLIEGPPPPDPWPELDHLHFNDRLIYVMRYYEGG